MKNRKRIQPFPTSVLPMIDTKKKTVSQKTPSTSRLQHRGFHDQVINVRSLFTIIVLFALACQNAFGQVNTEPTESDRQEWIQGNDLGQYASAAEKWNNDVRQLSKSNPTEGGSETVLCLGSSSFRLWDSIDTDMAPYTVLRRAYGGAKFCDLAIHTPELVHGLRFRSAMIFVANDITGSETDKTPQEIQRLAELVIQKVREQNSAAPIFLVAITPTPSRFDHWSKIQAANVALQELATRMQHVYFVPTQEHYLTNDKPRSELFTTDRLHQNETGYKLWASVLKKSLDQYINSKE
jgi:hypothetical protein